MAYRCETYATIKTRLTDWLRVEGSAVTDLELDLLNRAQEWLWRYKPWDGLIKRADLTLTDKACTLPSDFGREIRLWHDSDNDEKPEFYYYRHGRYDDGYYIIDTFAKATGHSLVITFYKDPTNTVTLEYQVNLTDFAGTGTEYSFFPGDLLLRTAQKLHLEDTGITDANEYQAIVASQEGLLRDFTQAHQYVNPDMRMEQLDDGGLRLDVSQDNLAGDTDGISNDYEPSYDLG